MSSDSPSLELSTDSRLRQRLYVMMFLQYFVQGSYLPVITEYLRSGLSFDPGQMGDFSAAIAVGPLIAPFFIGQIVDRHFATQHVLAVCHLLGGGLMLALYTLEAYWPILILGAIYSALYVPSMMLTNSLAFHHLQDREREFPRVRLWGTIGFIAPAWMVEIVLLRGLSGPELDRARGIVLAVAGISGIVMGLYSLTLPHTPPTRSDKKELAPGKILALLRHRNFLVLVLVSLVVAVSHKFFFVWNSPFLRSLLWLGGVEGAWEGRISSIGQIFEILVMVYLGFAIKRFGFKRTLAAGAVAYLVRCLIFAGAVQVSDQFALAMTLVCLGQALHGFCFGCFLAAAYIYVDRVSPPDARGSMQTFYGTFIIGVGTFVGGLIAGRIGGQFETLPGVPPLRSKLGWTGDGGMLEFVRDNVTLRVDYPGIWLSGAVLSLIAVVGLWVFFPSDHQRPPAAEEVRPA